MSDSEGSEGTSEGTSPERPAGTADDQPPYAPPAWPPPPAGYGTPEHGTPPQYGTQAPYGTPPSTAGPVGVHPLHVGRALTVAWSLFRFRWKTMVAALAVLVIPGQLLGWLWYAAYGRQIEAWYVEYVNRAGLPGAPRPTLDQLPQLPTEAWTSAVVIGLLGAIVTLLGGAALAHILGWTYGGGSTSVARAIGAALSRSPSLIAGSLLIFLAIVGIVVAGVLVASLLTAAIGGGLGIFVALIGFVTAIVAVVFVLLRWTFFASVIMLEGRGALASLGRSWRLVSGSTWRVLGYVLLVWLVVAILGVVAAIVDLLLFGFGFDMVTRQLEPFDIWNAFGRQLLRAVFTVLVTPWAAAVFVLLYYDLRWRAGEQIGPPPA